MAAAAAFGAAAVQQHIQEYAASVEGDVPQYMAAVLQCVASKLLQCAGDAAREGDAARIEPQHIWRAVRRDGELSRLVRQEEGDAEDGEVGVDASGAG